jgi:hypothetical protein
MTASVGFRLFVYDGGTNMGYVVLERTEEQEHMVWSRVLRTSFKVAYFRKNALHCFCCHICFSIIALSRGIVPFTSSDAHFHVLFRGRSEVVCLHVRYRGFLFRLWSLHLVFALLRYKRTSPWPTETDPRPSIARLNDFRVSVANIVRV